MRSMKSRYRCGSPTSGNTELASTLASSNCTPAPMSAQPAASRKSAACALPEPGWHLFPLRRRSRKRSNRFIQERSPISAASSEGSIMNIALPQRRSAATIAVRNDAPIALPERPNIHEVTVQGVIAYMQSHIGESLSLGRLSDVAGFSPWHLDRIFTRETGLATMRYLTLLRIEAAKNAALGSDRRIIEIAYDVGFNSLGSFGKRFTYLVGMSPRDLRKAADRF